jgi:hypothetical protein
MFSKLQQFYYIKHSNNANQFEQSEQMGENVSPCTFTNESDKFSLHITPALPHILKSIHITQQMYRLHYTYIKLQLI